MAHLANFHSRSCANQRTIAVEKPREKLAGQSRYMAHATMAAEQLAAASHDDRIHDDFARVLPTTLGMAMREPGFDMEARASWALSRTSMSLARLKPLRKS